MKHLVMALHVGWTASC